MEYNPKILVRVNVYREKWAVPDTVMKKLPWLLRKSLATLLSTPRRRVGEENVEVLVRDANQFDSNARDLIIEIVSTGRSTPTRNQRIVIELAKQCRTVVYSIVTGEDMTVDRVIRSVIELGPHHKASRQIWTKKDRPWATRRRKKK